MNLSRLIIHYCRKVVSIIIDETVDDIVNTVDDTTNTLD